MTPKPAADPTPAAIIESQLAYPAAHSARRRLARTIANLNLGPDVPYAYPNYPMPGQTIAPRDPRSIAQDVAKNRLAEPDTQPYTLAIINAWITELELNPPTNLLDFTHLIVDCKYQVINRINRTIKF